MNFHAVTGRAQTRIVTENVDDLKKIKKFGVDNIYPQQVEYAIQYSGTASGVAEIYQDFIQGEGFEDETLNDVVVNRDGETLYDILEYVAYDMSRHHGFAIHSNFNLLGESTELRRVKFKQCRLGIPDDKGYVGTIAVSKGWGSSGGFGSRRKSKKDDVVYIHKFNPVEKVLMAQIREAGDIHQYKGQLFYYTPETDVYPLSPFDPVLEDIETDAQIKVFKNNAIKNNFLAFYIFKYFGTFEGEDGGKKKEALLNELKKFQGPESKKIMLAEMGNVPEEIAKAKLLEKVDLQDFDRLYEYTEKSVKSNIIDNRKVPQALFSKYEGSTLGQSSKIFSEAAQQYNRVTFRERATIKRAFEKVTKYFPELKDRDFTIKELHSGLVAKEPEPGIPPPPEPQNLLQS